MTEVTTQQNKEQLLHFMYGFDEYAYADPSPYYPEIEAIRTGQFTDMNGKPITIDIALLDALVENFANNKAGQEIPIDLNHERKEAAGWLLGVRRLNNSLFVAPNWNELGLSMVHSKQYRYVSCTIDLVEKYLLSVSLTNFPAVNNMRPIELSRMNEGASSSLIVLFQKPEESMAKDVNVKPTEEKVVPPAESESKTPPAELSASATPATPVVKSDIPNRDEVVAQFRQQADAEIASIRKQLNDLLGDLQAQRQAAVADFMSQVRTERQIAEFSERVTSTGKHAIPAKPADVAAVLSALPAANREAVQNLLESIYAGGTVDFSEMGTSAGKPIAAEAVQLSSEWQRVLRSHINTGGTVDEFFALNADLLGDKGKYDLGAFAKKES